MNISSWLKPFWVIVRSAVKWRLHQLVDEIDETSVSTFKLVLHERINRF